MIDRVLNMFLDGTWRIEQILVIVKTNRFYGFTYNPNSKQI